MPNILTPLEASHVLRCETDDPLMLDLLRSVDFYIEQATGRDWTADAPVVHVGAKQAARILLTLWHENPAGIGANTGMMPAALSACLGQLEAYALTLESDGIPLEALKLVKCFPTYGDEDIAITITPVLIFNHVMAAAALTAITLKTAAGATVSATKSADATGKIVTITPAASLAAASTYTIVITAAPDEYGQTITQEIGFRTA